MCKYMMRVGGLGEIEAILLPSSPDEKTARRNIKAGMGTDRRRTFLGLYEIEKLDMHGADSDIRPETLTLYLVAGSIKKDGKTEIIHRFAKMLSDALAKEYAHGLNLAEGNLYRCTLLTEQLEQAT